MADETKNDEAEDDAGKPEPPPHHEDVVSETTHTVTIAGADDRVHGHGRPHGRSRRKRARSRPHSSRSPTSATTSPIAAAGRSSSASTAAPAPRRYGSTSGALGPRRVVLQDDGMPLPPPGRLTDNEYSILDVADLVFIDPVSTGFSRAIPEEEAKTLPPLHEGPRVGRRVHPALAGPQPPLGIAEVPGRRVLRHDTVGRPRRPPAQAPRHLLQRPHPDLVDPQLPDRGLRSGTRGRSAAATTCRTCCSSRPTPQRPGTTGDCAADLLAIAAARRRRRGRGSGRPPTTRWR